jgi:hypothetical protein
MSFFLTEHYHCFVQIKKAQDANMLLNWLVIQEHKGRRTCTYYLCYSTKECRDTSGISSLYLLSTVLAATILTCALHLSPGPRSE